MPESVGARIRALRNQKKLTLDQLADQAGLSKSYLWELENKDPREKLETATDKAFFREYHQMTTEMKAKLRRMAKLLDE
jgi:transcriptional regulator with XRE-family HTH domain